VSTTLAVAADGLPWEAALVAALDRGGHGISVVRRCVDIVELLSVAVAGHARVALVAGGLPDLDADAVARLHAAGVAVVGIRAGDDARSGDRLHALGIGYIVADGADAAVVAAVVREAATSSSAGAELPAYSDPIGDAATPASTGGSARETPAPSREGRVIAVWGPTGAPGRTTVAIALADEIARLGAAALLVDADVYGGTIVSRLGILDDASGLLAACRAATGARLDGDALAQLACRVAPALHVLTGIPRAHRWPELRPSGITVVLTAARQLADWTVVDCGFSLETDEELSFDSMAPRRNGATLAVLDCADTILVVGAGDPIGINRLVHALDELRDAGIAGPPAAARVVVNKVRAGAVSGTADEEIVAALRRFAATVPDALLPYDGAACDRSVALGRLPSEVAHTSPLRRAVGQLAREITGIEGRASRRRRLAARD
jgi:MinD-like ATPase involved in chromosome partitioning or flagellar assembly